MSWTEFCLQCSFSFWYSWIDTNLFSNLMLSSAFVAHLFTLEAWTFEHFSTSSSPFIACFSTPCLPRLYPLSLETHLHPSLVWNAKQEVPLWPSVLSSTSCTTAESWQDRILLKITNIVVIICKIYSAAGPSSINYSLQLAFILNMTTPSPQVLPFISDSTRPFTPSPSFNTMTPFILFFDLAEEENLTYYAPDHDPFTQILHSCNYLGASTTSVPVYLTIF